MSTLSIASSALQNAAVGLRTAANNISNAAAPGYSRQEVQMVTQISNRLGSSSWVGNGANIGAINRIHSDLMNNQVNIATSAAKKNDLYLQNTTQLESLLSNLDSNISSAMGEFYSAASALGASPGSTSAQARLMNAASSIANQFQEMDLHFDNFVQGVNESMSGVVSDLNSMAQELANINADENAGSNEMLDRQELLAAKISEKVSAQVIRKPGGQMDILMSNGQPLVIGSSNYKITTFRSLDDPEHFDLGQVLKDGTIVQLGDSAITGGELAGLLEFRKDTLTATRNTLGRMATVFAQSVNEMQKLSQTNTGQQGSEMFHIDDPVVYTYKTNQGDAQLKASITDTSSITAASYRIAKTSSGWEITNLSSNQVTSTPSLPISIDGFDLDIDSGSVSDGDRFRLDPARNGLGSIKMLINNVDQLSIGYPVYAKADAQNIGPATINFIKPASTSWDPSIQDALDVDYDSVNGFTIAGSPPDNVTQEIDGWTIEQNGWIMKIQGTPADGDIFHIGAASTSGDGRAANDLAGLQNERLIAGGFTISGSYSAMVDKIGSQGRIAASAYDASQVLLDQATSNRDNISGVNLDEEAVSLTKWQQMFQAASKMVTVTNSMLDSLFAAIN